MKHLLTLVTLLSMAVASTAVAAPKNIVLILADDLGWADTTLYGKTSLYETPNIERLAARGMTFSSAYSSPICSPTRASIMTGRNPARHGMTAPAAHLKDVRFDPVANTSGPPHQKSANVRSSTRLDPSIPSLAQLLKDAGYSTAHFGKWHLGLEPHSPLELGFDADIPHWHGPGPKTSYLAPWGYENPNFKEGKPGEHIEDRMAQEAVAWLKQRDPKKPFFMNYWQFSVHAPFGAKPELIDRYRKKIQRGGKQQSPTYAAMVHSLDDAVGSLLDALEKEGILDETVIVFYSDNGGNIHCGLEETDAKGEKYITAITSNHPLRGGKGGIHEGGVRVPAVVVWPGVTKPGSLSDVRIQSNDLYPTILRMLNVERPKDHVIDGVDFASALRGEDMDRGPMFTHVPGHGNTPQWLPPSTSVHHGDWKMIRTYHYGEDGRHQYRLYNLRDDIGENNNLASAHPDKVKAMDQLIENYIAEASVVVPLPNPKFDPAKFDPSQIGVQAGGLKMPPSKNKQPKGGPAKPATTVNKASMLGWIAKNAAATVQGDSLRLSPNGRQAFIANAKVRANGPSEVRMRLRSQAEGKARLQWRTEGQDLFPKTGQTKSFAIAGGDWQELKVALPVEGRLVHWRLFLPNGKKPVEIDWIEAGSKRKDAADRKRWDFAGPAKPKQKAKKTGDWRVTKLADDLETAEGPVWSADGTLYFTEIFANQVHEYTPETGGIRAIRRESGGSNGMALDSRKRLVMCEMLGKRVIRRERDGTIVPLWQAEHQGKGGPNDVVIGSSGNIYFTMPRHKRVYRIFEGDQVEPFVSNIAGINGVILSRDEKTLFVTVYKKREIHAFPINERTGIAGTGRLFAQIQTAGTEHGADGMAIDDQDQLYVACLGGVWVFDAQGEQVRFIPLPGEKVTNCAFAGDDFNTLYITTQQGLFCAVRNGATSGRRRTNLPVAAKPHNDQAKAGPARTLPNVVLILADDLGYGDVGCYGAPDVKTPVMDQLAKAGVRCTDGYAAFPVCSPSRAALLTGRYPARFGPTYEDYYGGGSPELDPEKHLTIGQMMKDAGYRTGCFGKWNVSNLNRRRANDFGFDSWVGLHLNHDFYTHKLLRTGEHDLYKDGEPFDRNGVWSDTIFADEAIAFINTVTTKNKEPGTKNPFFIYLPFQAPHSPYQDPNVPLDPPGKKERKTLIKMIERLDLEIGRVLKALDDQKLAGNTLVIVTSDNGGAQVIGRNLPLSGAKQMLLEGGVRVPLILRWPGVLPAGKEFSTPVTAMDLTATVAAAGNAKPRTDTPFDGVDLLPVLTGKAELKADRPLFFRRRNIKVHANQNDIRQSAVRQGDWKYLRTYQPLGTGKYQSSLYNLNEDIAEEKNLAASNPTKLKELSDLLEAWEAEMSETAIPFAASTPAKRKKK